MKTRASRRKCYKKFQEIFNDIFFEYPNGLGDRSVKEPRDAKKFIRNWYVYDAMRNIMRHQAAAKQVRFRALRGLA